MTPDGEERREDRSLQAFIPTPLGAGAVAWPNARRGPAPLSCFCLWSKHSCHLG